MTYKVVQYCFNPLFIRSVFLFLVDEIKRIAYADEFQSLIHQVSVSFKEEKMTKCTICKEVSIPYSSGQCFF